MIYLKAILSRETGKEMLFIHWIKTFIFIPVVFLLLFNTIEAEAIVQIEEMVLYLNPDDNSSQNRLDAVGQFYRLNKLTISGIHLDEFNYSSLLNLKNLRYIRLKSSYSYNIDNNGQILTKLPDFPYLYSIEHIEINDHEFENLDGIEKFPNLKTVILECPSYHQIIKHTPRPIKSLKALANLKHLQSLTIMGNEKDRILISDLIGLDTLKEIKIPWYCDFVDFSGIGYLDNLEYIDIHEDINTFNIEEIGKLANIKSLKIPIQGHVKSFDFLKNFMSLEYLYLTNKSCLDALIPNAVISNNNFTPRLLDIGIIKNMVNLRHLYLKYFSIKNFNLLNNFQSLESVGIEFCSFVPPENNLLNNPNIMLYYGYEH
jgi:hypothetical protein